MIGYLQGKPIIQGESLLILTNGVGYQVAVGTKTLRSLTASQVELFIHTHVREDKLELYGFQTLQQRQLFEMLLNVSGIGPKTALEITDQDPEKIVNAVQNAEVSYFKSIPRIGKKMAQKIILELKPKLGSLKELSLGPRSAQEHDLYAALEVLGYEESEIAMVIEQIDLQEIPLEQAVKQALLKLQD